MSSVRVVTHSRLFGLVVFGVVSATAVGAVRSVLNLSGRDIHFDEALILQTVDSLVGQRQYASYGIIRGFGPWLFDPNMTTGPVVALVAAPFWWISGGSIELLRLVMCVVALLYLSGIVALTRGSRNRALVTGVCMLPFIFAAETHFGEVLGELPGATLVVWATVMATRRRFLLAALLLGLAVQVKLLFAPFVAFGLVALVWQAREEQGRPFIRAVRLGAVAAVPTLAFELWRLVTFRGVSGYRRSIEEWRAYVARQNVNTWGSWRDSGMPGTKWDSFLGLMPLAAWLLVLLALIAGVLLPALSRARRDSLGVHSELPPPSLLLGLLAGSAVMFLGWFTQSVQAYSRQVLPVVLLAVPSAVLLASRNFHLSPPKVRSVSGVLMLALTAVLALGQLGLAWHRPLSPFSDDQRAALDLIEESGATSLLANGWYVNPEYGMFARLPVTHWVQPMGQLAVVNTLSGSVGVDPLAQFGLQCDRVLLRRPTLAVCEPEVPDYAELQTMRVVDWGEKDLELGVVSRKQVDGFGGLWMILEPEDPAALRAVQVLVDGYQIEVGEVTSDGSVITALVPPSVYRTPGRHVIELRNAISGQVIPVGEFTL